ncbi:Diadenosine tetraphosphatase, partial [Giardia duodenalis]
VSTRPSRRSPYRGGPQGSTGSRRGPTQTSRSCDSHRPPGLPHVSTGARDPGTCLWRGRPCRRETHFNRLLTRTHQLPDRAATHCLQMRGLLTDEERAVKERQDSVLDHEARHDRLVPVPPPVGELSPELEIKTHSHLHDQSQKPDIWLIDKCKTIDVGVTLPRQMDHCYNEKLRKHRDGTLPIIYGTDGSLHPVRRHLGAPCGC